MTISITGCGWLGTPLAQHFIAQGHSINGSTTTEAKLPKLKAQGIDPFYIELTGTRVKGEVFSFLDGAEVLVVAVPPGLRKQQADDFTLKMKHFVMKVALSEIEKVILISSTSVFEATEDFTNYNEKSLANGKGKAATQLITIEDMFLQNPNFETSVVRFGGLVGENRHPVKYLAGRENVKNPDAPVNLIHQKDAINVLDGVVKNNDFGIIFHGVYPDYPDRKTYYTEKAKELGLNPPSFDEETTSKGKQIEAIETQKRLEISFSEKP